MLTRKPNADWSTPFTKFFPRPDSSQRKELLSNQNNTNTTGSSIPSMEQQIFFTVLPIMRISIGLTRGTETIFGAVHHVVRKECFYAREGYTSSLQWKGDRSFFGAVNKRKSPGDRFPHTISRKAGCVSRHHQGFPTKNRTASEDWAAPRSISLTLPAETRRLF